MVKPKYQQGFEQILNSETIKRVFELNEGKNVPILKGHRVTRHESNFKKGRNYGKYEKCLNIYKPGTLAWFIAAGGECQNKEGHYIIELDSETYELKLTPEGLKHQIVHEYRIGSRFALGPDKSYQEGLHKEILASDFLTNRSGLLMQREIYSFIHDLKTELDAIVCHSKLSERKIVDKLKDLEKCCLKGKDFTPKKHDLFRTLSVLGYEKDKEGTVSELNFLLEVQTHPIGLKSKTDFPELRILK